MKALIFQKPLIPCPVMLAYLSMSYTVDFVASGKPDIQGNIPVLTDLDALNNAIKLWLCSFRGERLYNPRKGGPIIGYLLKPMSEEIVKDMKTAIREGLKNDFVPSVKVSKCDVFADYENSQYVIDLIGYCPSLNSDVHYTDKINSLR
jgi:phage baseplate assembly protein W